jgi:HSP20 family molecular chaperone IbpA
MPHKARLLFSGILLVLMLPVTVWGYGAYDYRDNRNYVPRPGPASGGHYTGALRVRTGMDENGYYARAYLEGTSPGDIQVYIRHNRLVLRISQGNRRAEQPANRQTSPAWQMSYTRKLRLPPDADWRQMRTTTNDGVTEIHIPRKSRYGRFDSPFD